MPINSLIVMVFLAIGVFFIANALFVDDEKKLSLKDINSLNQKERPLLEVLNALGSFNALLFKTFPKMKISADERLTKLDTKLKAEGFWFIKEVLVAGALSSVILFQLEGPLFVAGIPLFLFIFPDLSLSMKIKDREFKILRTFPEIIDLMGLCLSAGLDFMATLKWLTEGAFLFDSPFVDELRKVKEEILLGKSKIQALKSMDIRLKIQEVSSLVRTLVIAEQMGVSVMDTFERFSLDIRDSRFQRGEREARMSAIKILFPLIFLILPVVGIVVMGPIAIKFSQNDMMSSIGM